MAEPKRPIQEKELDRVCVGAGMSSGSKKSGSTGLSLAEFSSSWAYYEKMSFLKPYLYIIECVCILVLTSSKS